MKYKLSALCLILALGGIARAADSKLDPTGTWKQTQPASQTRETTFTLRLQGERLTGTILNSSGSIAITNGTVKGDQVSFQTIHEASAPKGTLVTTTFTGTLTADTITGKRAVKTASNDYGSTPWQIKRAAVKSSSPAQK